jgi:hypothetical protein
MAQQSIEKGANQNYVTLSQGMREMITYSEFSAILIFSALIYS